MSKLGCLSSVDSLPQKPLLIKSFDNFESHLQNHRAVKHPFFSYLKKNSTKGFSPQQFKIYRDNYFFRTFHTIPSVARLVVQAALNSDVETAVTACQNLYEELGEGKQSKTHSQLLEFSHNFHAKKVFQLEALPIKEAVNSPFALREAQQFVDKERELYCHNEYGIVLGTAFAHEFAANSMLTYFFESFFVSYEKYYTKKEFETVSEYFSVHINGLEEQHAEHMRLAVKRFYQSQNSLQSLITGAFSFLEAQAHLWDALYLAIQNAENEHQITPLLPLY